MNPDEEMIQIEAEFLESWNSLVAFYAKLTTQGSNWQWLQPIDSLITELHNQGYDRKFRAGTSLWGMMLSRSRRHGLRFDQHFISICPSQDGTIAVASDINLVMYDVTNLQGTTDNDAPKVLVLKEPIITLELENLLAVLEQQPID